MATPKTPFRPRRSPTAFSNTMSNSSTKNTSPVLGVVSKDSNDDDGDASSQTTPQPSPVQPPAPQTRQRLQRNSTSTSRRSSSQSRRASEQQALDDAQSLTLSIPSSLPDNDEQELPPPSPYSPPPESLWSEHTEDQWPYSHTKRQFQKPAVQEEHVVAAAPLSNRSNQHSYSDTGTFTYPRIFSAEKNARDSRPYVPPLSEVMTQQQEETEHAHSRLHLSASATPARQSRLPPPSSSRSSSKNRRYSSPKDNHGHHLPSAAAEQVPPADDGHPRLGMVGDAEALFLLQEEHKVLQSEYNQMETHWRTVCEGLQNHSAKREDYVKDLQDELKTREEMIEKLQDELKHRGEVIQQFQEAVDSMPETTRQAQEQREENDRKIQELTLNHESLATAFEALRNDKETVERNLEKLQEADEAVREGNELQIAKLQKENTQLERKREALNKRVNQYESEVVHQSKRILELEESLAQSTQKTAQDIRSVQSESLARGNAWAAEKEALQAEVQNLREQLVDKDQEMARLLNEERRRQTGQIRDLEKQVQYLTNTLAEWQGRHSELRATVDGHLQFKPPSSTTVDMSTVACQTEETEEAQQGQTTTSPGSTSAPAESSSPLTPSVRFVETIHVPRSSSSAPMSAQSIRQPSPHSMCFSQRSVANESGSPHMSSSLHHSDSHTPSSSSMVSPWIPTWAGRSLHSPADPPPSGSSKASFRSLSPPAATHPRPASFRQDAQEDRVGQDEYEDQLEDPVLESDLLETAPPTVRAHNPASSSGSQNSVKEVRPTTLRGVLFCALILSFSHALIVLVRLRIKKKNWQPRWKKWFDQSWPISKPVGPMNSLPNVGLERP